MLESLLVLKSPHKEKLILTTFFEAHWYSDKFTLRKRTKDNQKHHYTPPHKSRVAMSIISLATVSFPLSFMIHLFFIGIPFLYVVYFSVCFHCRMKATVRPHLSLSLLLLFLNVYIPIEA